MTYNKLIKNLKKNYSGFKKINCAILGDSATQFLTKSLIAQGYNFELNLSIYEADFNQIEREIFDDNSELYKFSPDIVIIFQSAQKILLKYNNTINDDERLSIADDRILLISSLINKINDNIDCKILYYNYNEIDDGVFGNFSNKVASSFLFQLRKLNYKLMLFALENPKFHIVDLSSIQNQLGKDKTFKSSIYVSSDVVLNLDSLNEVSLKTLSLINSINARAKKCIILDLDNTMWGGVIGDDGLENIQIGSLGIGKAFSEFQHWVKKLKERGIIIAICSKNTESIAKEPFTNHPDMVLTLEDISIFIANWDNKADNIQEIQSVLNIGFDSMVFIDDNPFERNIVKQNIPEVTVPDLPEDPANYLDYLYTLNLFETINYSKADSDRTKQYQNEAKRNVVKKKYTNVDDYLKSLNMISSLNKFNKFNRSRVSQLCMRSNQFNLRTIRYNESDIESVQNSNKYYDFAFNLEDKFGDNGLISVLILKINDDNSVFVDTWIMSCRVLIRGMEEFILNSLVDYLIDKGHTKLTGEYIPTKKNIIVRDLYKNLGFVYKNQFWELEIHKFKQLKTQITLKNE